MRMKITEVEPGQVWNMLNESNERSTFLKLHDQRVVNLTEMRLVKTDIDFLRQEVEILKHPLDSYLMVGGIDE